MTIKYRGPDQRKESRAIVLGMACPRCGGDVHDPLLSRDRARQYVTIEHARFACMSPTCDWVSTRASIKTTIDPAPLLRRLEERRRMKR
jgi:hypothetical protein